MATPARRPLCSPASPRAKTLGDLGVDFVCIDQGDLAVGHLARPSFDLGGPQGIGARVRIFGIQTGDEVVRQRRTLRGGQVQCTGSNLNRCHGTYFATFAGTLTRGTSVTESCNIPTG